MTRPALFALPLTGCALAAAPTAAQPLADLAELEWRHRVIVIRVGDGLTLAAAQRALDGARAALRERHMVWFAVSESTVHTNLGRPVARAALQRHLAAPGVVLIGKDGEVKARQQALDLPAVFARIDRMPMRQAEVAAQRRAR